MINDGMLKRVYEYGVEVGYDVDSMSLLTIMGLVNSTTDIDELCVFQTMMMILKSMDQVCKNHNLDFNELIRHQFDVLG